MQELPFLHSARRLMLIDICMKFSEDGLRGFQVTEWTRFVTDRWTDRQTDRRPGKNKMSPNPEGGDIIRRTSRLIVLFLFIPDQIFPNIILTWRIYLPLPLI